VLFYNKMQSLLEICCIKFQPIIPKNLLEQHSIRMIFHKYLDQEEQLKFLGESREYNCSGDLSCYTIQLSPRQKIQLFYQRSGRVRCFIHLDGVKRYIDMTFQGEAFIRTRTHIDGVITYIN
jgi:hypothetical protein